jgi:hypothetical protein
MHRNMFIRIVKSIWKFLLFINLKYIKEVFDTCLEVLSQILYIKWE